jgi:DMSO/TMAO reductase YedYZ molybdopterin-dependent catalytic subunit
MTVDGEVATSHTWTWADVHRVPSSEYRGDIHCITT